jgi:RNA polymerase sigma-70 factor, ECF subfamily
MATRARLQCMPHGSQPRLDYGTVLEADQLAADFLAALPSELLSTFQAWPALSEALARVVADARKQWPGILLDEGEFAAYLAERTAPDEDGATLPLHAVDLYLAWACVRGDATAVGHFDDAVLDRTGRVLARLGLSGADADDVKQDLRVRLLLPIDGAPPRLASYQGIGPLVTWTSAVAGRQGLALKRRQKPHQELDDDLLGATDDPYLAALRDRHRQEFKAAFQGAVADLAPRDRAVLRALLVDDRGIGEIAFFFGIHRVTASRWIARIRGTLLSGTRARLRLALSLDESDLDSVILMVDSQLDVSLYRLLADSP